MTEEFMIQLTELTILVTELKTENKMLKEKLVDAQKHIEWCHTVIGGHTFIKE